MSNVFSANRYWRATFLHDSRLPALGLTILLIVPIFIFSPNFQYQDSSSASPFAGDFLHEWLGAYVVLHGDRARFYDLDYAERLQHDPRVVGFSWDETAYLPLVYPPFYYLLISPLALMPMTTAAIIWAGLMVGCFVASAVVISWSIPDAHSKLLWAMPASVLFMPLIENFNTSQKATLILLLLTSTYALLRKRRPFVAGVVFGLLLFKPQLTVVIGLALLWKRQWRFTAGAIVTGLLLLSLSLLSLGMDVNLQYFKLCLGFGDYLQTSGYDYHRAHCWSGAFHLLLGGLPHFVIQAATLLATAVTMLMLAQLCRGPLDFSSDRFCVQYSGLVIATALLSPHLYTYDLAFLLLPMYLLAVLLIRGGDPLRNHRLALIGTLVALLAMIGVFVIFAEATRIQLTVISMFVLLVLLTKQPNTGWSAGASDKETSRTALIC